MRPSRPALLLDRTPSRALLAVAISF